MNAAIDVGKHQLDNGGTMQIWCTAEYAAVWPADPPSSSRIRGMDRASARAGGRLCRYPGGTEKASIFATVREVDPKAPCRFPLIDPLYIHRPWNLPV